MPQTDVYGQYISETCRVTFEQHAQYRTNERPNDAYRHAATDDYDDDVNVDGGAAPMTATTSTIESSTCIRVYVLWFAYIIRNSPRQSVRRWKNGRQCEKGRKMIKRLVATTTTTATTAAAAAAEGENYTNTIASCQADGTRNAHVHTIPIRSEELFAEKMVCVCVSM